MTPEEKPSAPSTFTIMDLCHGHWPKHQEDTFVDAAPPAQDDPQPTLVVENAKSTTVRQR